MFGDTLDATSTHRRLRDSFRNRDTEATVFTALDGASLPVIHAAVGGTRWRDDFRDRGDTFSFRRLDADFRQYFPLLKEHWVLVLRGQAQITAVEDGQVIPFYLLPSLGGANTLRGYSDFRFQDNHMLVVGAEYRWLPSRIVDMAIFVDAGKVAAERRDLELENLKTT